MYVDPIQVKAKVRKVDTRWCVYVAGYHHSSHGLRETAERRANRLREALLRSTTQIGRPQRTGDVTDADLDRLAERLRGAARIAAGGTITIEEGVLRSIIGSYRSDGRPAGIGYREMLDRKD